MQMINALVKTRHNSKAPYARDVQLAARDIFCQSPESRERWSGAWWL